MSAWIVSHAHIDALLTFCEANRSDFLQRLRFNSKTKALAGKTWTEIGRVLLTENTKSVLARYPDDTEESAPGTDGETVAGYKFKPFTELPNMPSGQACVWIIKACNCFDYQACETDEYPNSVAHALIETIRNDAIHALPGFNEAPWGITRAHVPA